MPGDAELPLQRDLAERVRARHADHDGQVAGVVRLGQHLFQLRLAIDGEGAHAMIEIGRADQPAALDRVHDMRGRALQRRDLLDLGEGSHVEIPHTGLMQRTEDGRRVVGLDGVQ
jgi:hypothetical protein